MSNGINPETRVSQFLSQATLFLLYAIVFLIPLVFYPRLSSVFELCKITVFFILVIWAAVFFLMRVMLLRQLPVLRPALLFPLGAYLCACFLSTLFTLHVPTSRAALAEVAAFYAFYALLVFACGNGKQKERFLWVFLFSSLFVCLYAILQHFRLDLVEWEDESIYLRSTSTLGNPDFVSAYMSLILPLAFCFIFGTKNKIRALYLTALLSTGYISLLFTYSRGGWLSAAAGLLSAWIFLGRAALASRWKTCLVMFLIFGCVSYIVGKQKVMIDQTSVNLSSRLASTVNIQYPSIAIRRHLWHDAIRMVKDNPILGTGLNTFTKAFPKYRSPELSALAGRNRVPEHAHNEYLQVAATLGFFGFFSWLWLIAAALVSGVRMLKNSGADEKYIYAGVLSAFCAFLFQSLVYYPIVATSMFLFLVFALFSSEKRPDDFESSRPFLVIPFSRLTVSIILVSLPLLGLSMSANAVLPFLADFHFRKGEAFVNRRQYKDAAVKFAQAKALSPNNKVYPLFLGKTYEQIAYLLKPPAQKEKEKLLKLALEEYKLAIQVSPLDSFSYLDLGRVYHALGIKYPVMLNEAEKAYLKAIETDPRNCVFYNETGLLYVTKKNAGLARKNFLKAAELDPTFTEAWQNMGISYYREKKYKEALKYLTKAKETAPQNAPIYVQIGLTYLDLKNNKNALLYLKKANELSPKNPAILKAISDIEKGKLKK